MRRKKENVFCNKSGCWARCGPSLTAERLAKMHYSGELAKI